MVCVSVLGSAWYSRVSKEDDNKEGVRDGEEDSTIASPRTHTILEVFRQEDCNMQGNYKKCLY